MPFNDERILNTSELEIHFDLMINNEFQNELKRHRGQVEDEEDDDFDNYEFTENEEEKVTSIKDVQKLKINKVKVGGFNKDDIDNFWNEDLSKFDNIE